VCAQVDDAPERLQQCLASCHSLTTVNNELIGDPLDLKMFAATGWRLHEPPEDERQDSVVPPRVCPPVPSPLTASPASSLAGGMGMYSMGKFGVGVRERRDSRSSDGSNDPDLHDAIKRWEKEKGLAIIKRFDFTSHHQRMSVIVRNETDRGSHIFLKGAPEVVRDLCDPASIPPKFTQVVQGYTRQGLRLLACAHAYRPAMSWHKAEKVNRDTAERGLKMLGILMLENRLKPESAVIIQQLSDAAIRSCMITGDHVLTAVTVSRNCCIINPLHPVLVTEVMTRPQQQQHVVASADRLVHSQSSAELEHGTLQGATARPKQSRALVHTSHPATDGDGARGRRWGEERRGEEVLKALEADGELLDVSGAGSERNGREVGEGGEVEAAMRWSARKQEPMVLLRLLEPEKGWGSFLTRHMRRFAGRSEGGEGDGGVGGAGAELRALLSNEVSCIALEDFIRLLATEDGGEGQGEDGRTDEQRQEQGWRSGKSWGRGMDFEVAVTGPAFEQLEVMGKGSGMAELKAVTKIAKIFARMSPDQKQSLVEHYGEEHQLTVQRGGGGGAREGGRERATALLVELKGELHELAVSSVYL
jgi:magnesium-transporting ATPase (P-type)